MDHIVVVKVIDSVENLSDCLRRIFFCELAVFADPIKEFSTSSQLCNDVVFVLQSPYQQ